MQWLLENRCKGLGRCLEWINCYHITRALTRRNGNRENGPQVLPPWVPDIPVDPVPGIWADEAARPDDGSVGMVTIWLELFIPTLPPVALLGNALRLRRDGWIQGSTPPWLIWTCLSSSFNSASFRTPSIMWRGVIVFLKRGNGNGLSHCYRDRAFVAIDSQGMVKQHEQNMPPSLHS